MQNIGLGAVLEDKNFQQGLQRYQQGISKMESATDRGASAMSRVWALGGAAVTIGAASFLAGIAGIVAASKVGLDTLSAWNDSVNTLSDNLGTSGQQSSAWAVAFGHVGLEVSEGTAGLNFFTKNLDDLKQGLDPAKFSPFQKAMKELGVNAFDAKGKLKTFDDVMPDLLDAFQKMPPGIKKSALAMDLFGARAGTKFLDFLSQGSEGLEKARQMAKEFGLELSTEESNAVEDFGFAINDLNLGLRGFWVTIGREVLPIASRLVSVVTRDILPPFLKWAQGVIPLLVKNGLGLVDLLGTKLMPPLTSVWNIVKLLATGNFEGGIFGFSEDSIFIGALFTAREVAMGLWNTLSKGDWAGAWKVITDGAGNLWSIVQDQIGDPSELVKGWGTKFWTWLTGKDGALDKAGGAFNEFIGKAKTTIEQYGPQAWDLALSWGGKFWTWLTDERDGALGKSKSAFNAFVEKVKPILAQYGPPAWDLATSWGGAFWGWLVDPKNGPIITASKNLEGLTAKFKEWANDQTTQKQLGEMGGSMGKGMIEGIRLWFADPKNTDGLIPALLGSLITSITNTREGIMTAGGAWAKSFIEGAVRDITGSDSVARMAGGIFEWIQAALKSFLDNGLLGLVKKFATDLGTMFQTALLDLHLTLPLTPFMPSVVPPFQPSAAPSAPTQQSQSVPFGQAGGASGAGGASVQAVPLSLQVFIGDQEIQNAVAKWSSETVIDEFGSAVAQVSGGAPP